MLENSLLLKKVRELKHEDAKRWLRIIDEICKSSENKLERINDLFPEYTDHGIEHCKSVVKALEELVIGKKRLSEAEWDEDKLKFANSECYLTLDEIILLILGALLHDIGMSPDIDYDLNKRAKEIREELERLKGSRREELRRELEELKEKIRKKHHEISREFVERSEELKDFQYRDVLARIVEGHRTDVREIFKNLRTVRNVRTSLLAFLLQIADDMDVGFRRALVESMHRLDEKSLEHVLANLRIGKAERSNGEVIYYVDFKEEFKIDEKEVLRLIVKWNGKIERKLERAKLYGGEIIRQWRGILPSKVVFKVESDRYNSDLSKRFEADRTLFVKTLSSNIYGDDWRYAFRELISNSFDAIKRRAYEDESYGNPRIVIDIKVDGDGYIIIVEDNGCGMSRDDVEDYLLTVGKSFYRELRERGNEIIKAINPTAYYGIGFLSSFMLVMDNNGKMDGIIEIETKRMDNEAVRVEIIEPDLPVILGSADKKDIGTRIMIKGKREEVRGFFEKVLRFGEVCRNNGIDVHIFPFAVIVDSVLKVRELEIPIVVKINGVKVWDGIVKPDLFIHGEKIKSIDVNHENEDYELEIWKGELPITEFGLIPKSEFDMILKDAEMVEKRLDMYELKLNDINITFHIHTYYTIATVNNVGCIVENRQLNISRYLRLNEQPVTYILRVRSSLPKYTDLKKNKIKISGEVVREIFKKLREEGITFDLDVFDSFDPFVSPCDEDFEEIGAMDFVENCLRFEDIYGECKTLSEIKGVGKTPIIVDIDFKFFEIFKYKFKSFWENLKLNPLYGEYSRFLKAYQKVSEYFFEKCEECGKDCIFGKFEFDGGGYYIKDTNLENFLFREFKELIALIYLGFDERFYILNNRFVKTICRMWKENRISEDEEDKIKYLLHRLNDFLRESYYVTLEDLKELAKIDNKLKEAYEMIMRWMQND
ncbi:MAG: hypothetical protein DRN91_01755 [Candidatus Alkanophagales archaeon]|nr:MAG: hypothetical protein DRN91_01755 [Candidatus Alkanophagales archaeon]